MKPALAACAAAAAHQRAVFAAAQAVVTERATLLRLLTQLAGLQLQGGRAAEAVAVCRERLGLCAGNAAALFEVGRDLAECASLVGTEPERQALLKEAVQALHKAVEAGFADRARWEQLAALKPLRDHAEFRQLQQKVQARASGR
jgi:hypothetical protein